MEHAGDPFFDRVFELFQVFRAQPDVLALRDHDAVSWAVGPTAVFTITSPNQSPIVSNIPDQTINGGASFDTINLDDYVDDQDNFDSEIRWSHSPSTNLNITIDANRVATIILQNPDWTGSETILY